MTKLKTSLSLISALVITNPAYSRPQGPPPLSVEVENCLIESVGSLSALEELSHEDRRSLLSSCGAEGPGQKPPRLQLSEEDQACLDGKIDKTDSRPSREDFDAALESCGIERPSPPSDMVMNVKSLEEIESLISKFEQSSNPGEQAHIKRVLKDSFYELNDEDLKDRIRTFLVSKIKSSNPVAVNQTTALASQ